MIKEDTKTLLKFNAEGIHPGEMYFNARQEAVKAVDNNLGTEAPKVTRELVRKLGLEEISTFISHYYKKPYHRLMWAIERRSRG